MSDSLMFNNDAYVVLETDRSEQLLTPTEMFDKLKEIVIKFADELPGDVVRIADINEPGEYLQWYAVRLEK